MLPELSDVDPQDIVSDFCEMLRKVIKKSPDCCDKCELVYYDGKFSTSFIKIYCQPHGNVDKCRPNSHTELWELMISIRIRSAGLCMRFLSIVQKQFLGFFSIIDNMINVCDPCAMRKAIPHFVIERSIFGYPNLSYYLSLMRFMYNYT